MPQNCNWLKIILFITMEYYKNSKYYYILMRSTKMPTKLLKGQKVIKNYVQYDLVFLKKEWSHAVEKNP